MVMTEKPTLSRTAHDDYRDFVTQQARGLGRLAYLLLGDQHAAEDLTAEVFLAVWRQWHQVSQADRPIAYVRRVMVNQAAAHFARKAREREGLERLSHVTTDSLADPDSAAVVDVQAALLRLPPRRRACLVLRFAFDLTEREVAAILGVSVGTVKSQTFKAAAQFRDEFGDALIETHFPGQTRPARPWWGRSPDVY
jgi:RNA polymerase sigma-70 factor (sigma-E family)